ncbi:MAG TPA: ATP-binding protein [Acidobacteriota bacterium]|jgi:signal transduction histidine kinase
MRLKPVNPELVAGLNRVFLDSLRPVTFALAALYLVIAVAQWWTLEGGAARGTLVIAAASSSALLVLLFLILGKASIRPARAHALGAGIAALVLANSFLYLYLTREPQQTTNLMLLSIGAGCLFLSLPWLTSVLGAVVVLWVIAVFNSPASPLWPHFGSALISSTVLSLLIFLLRYRTLLRLEELRFQDNYQKLILKEALQSAEREIVERNKAQEELKKAYDEMELRVQERTAALAKINHQMSLEIAERNRMEREQQQLQQQLSQAQKLESLGIFAGGIAHDFNNLLLVITANADLALKGIEQGARARTNVERIAVASSRAAELTSQLLAYTGKGAREPQAVNLSNLVRETAGLLESVISKKATLKLRLEQDMPPIRADAGQARQVVMNLIINASEALEDGAGIIVISTGSEEDAGVLSDIQPRADSKKTYGYVEVKDDGCGMAPEAVAKIFDPFFTTKTTGRGLGLATVLGIVRGHQGAIRVDSNPGKGSTFRVLFPCMEQKEAKAQAPAPGLEDWRGKGTVLVVDDEASVRETAQSILEEYGFTVLTARNGRECTHLLRSRSSELALVLLDLKMPEMNGDEVLLEIRSLRSDLPVILSSGYHENMTPAPAGNGSTVFIHKPYLPQDLIRKIRQLLG